ncbi:exodeoxyribonuclease VII large subunit [Natronobacillus azotifigens]|uniref:Exodeoxyribonuclease 7 large subunit n=1 Tax=Natronobacillus azotifigens TaxID=472978 RepID=A0A9J6REW1_9BACI|nr:exodeoxyribonuclease VII large subunit [Natronobacillus azotifigens]MCZ0704095.1 exodeoxyribonuclease VII large subunit [Natronobacillus azotifigens]
MKGQDNYLTVTALTRYIKRKFELDKHLTTVWLKGEISNFKHHSRGHMYFTLKDEQSRIQSVMFAGNNRSLKFTPESGMQVLIKGEVSVYEPQGQYQLYVHEMEPDGIGALQLAYEQLRNKLREEGLFSSDRKKTLPLYPKHVGIVTSPTGAAVRDILITLKRRYPLVNITLFPVLVQGLEAKYSIANAIDQANTLESLDLLIVGRGGGSLEELWAFNEELVVRAIDRSRIPIISAVGHETDSTIADFAADVRAATPTAAAELAVPSQAELIDKICRLQQTIHRQMKQKTSADLEKLERLKKSYAFRYPRQLITQKEQELDRLLERLNRQTSNTHKQKQEQLQQLVDRISRSHPMKQLEEAKEQLLHTKQQVTRSFSQLYQTKVEHFTKQLEKLEILSPLSIMRRGYTISYRNDGKMIKSVKQVQPGEQISVKLTDGSVDCQVWGIEEGENVES